MSFLGRDILSIRDLSREDLELILDKSKIMEKIIETKKNLDFASGRVLASLFFEPSTRTRFSFESAMHRLGGRVVGISERETTSLAKGETLADTIKTIEKYSDVIVIRHPKEGSARWAAEVAKIPVINAGDGANQHPTQTLLDLYSIKKEKGKIDGLSIALVGDLKYGRTVHSLAYALAHYDSNIICISPKGLEMPESVINDLKSYNSSLKQTHDLKELVDADVIYVTRIQRERFADPSEYEKVKGTYRLSAEILRNTDAIVLHPLPRIDEIDPSLDSTAHAKYFDQVLNGLIVRMALLCLVLGVDF
ncbi:MAG: aspartate carbamoyltransferase [Candidatus Hydrothermarchaeota archaeon]